MIVLVIITIVAALGLPTLAREMKDRGTRRAGEQVALIYRNARLQSMGRGSAILVRFDAGANPAGSFRVREAVRGGNTICSRLPSSSCALANWEADATSDFGSQAVREFDFSASSGVENPGLRFDVDGPAAIGNDVTRFDLCFTPTGRAFVRYNADVTWIPMTGIPIVRVYRTDGTATVAIGLERRVVILPNGNARLEVSGGRS